VMLLCRNSHPGKLMIQRQPSCTTTVAQPQRLNAKYLPGAVAQLLSEAMIFACMSMSAPAVSRLIAQCRPVHCTQACLSVL